MFNFPCLITFTYYLLLNSSDGNDAKQRVFLGRLLVALESDARQKWRDKESWTCISFLKVCRCCLPKIMKI